MINLANSFSLKPNFLVIDMEDADGYKKKNGMPSNQTLKDICTVEGDMFEKAGYFAMVYASSSWFNNQLKGLTRFAKWVAHWPTKNGKQLGNAVSPDGENASRCAIWQFTSEGRLNGYNGRLDMNYGYNEICVRKKEVKKSNEEIAKEVLEGKWGNGEDRKKRLTEAGYNYNEIQSIVNKLSNETTHKKTNEQIANEVIAGKWGNGQERKDRLTKAGYDYKAIQDIVNKKLKQFDKL